MTITTLAPTAQPLGAPTPVASAATPPAPAPQPGPGAPSPTSVPALDAARWLYRHRDVIGTVVATAGLVAMLPLARTGGVDVIASAASVTRHSRVGQAIAGTRVGTAARDAARSARTTFGAAIRSTRPGAVTADAALRGWNALREARMAAGETLPGRALLRAQQPLYVAGGVLGVTNLVQDARDWSDGHGNVGLTALHAVSVVPLASDVAKRFARARAASTEVQAAEHAASDLAIAQERTSAALHTAHSTEAPSAVRSAADTTAAKLESVGDAATLRAAEVADEAKLLAPASGAAPPDAPTFAVAELKAEVDAAHRSVRAARDVARAAPASHVVIGDRLDIAVARTERAHATLERAEVRSTRLTARARQAEKLEHVASTGSIGMGVAANSASYHTASSRGQEDQASSSADRILRTAASVVLMRNAAPPSSSSAGSSTR